MSSVIRVGVSLAMLGSVAFHVACDEQADESAGWGGAAAGGDGGAGAVGGTVVSTGGSGAASGGAAGTGGTAVGGGGGGSSVDGCPPEGPFGTEPGYVAPNVTLYDCAGSPVQLDELCPRRAAYVYTFAAWCPNCQSFASSGEANVLYDKYRNDDFAMWFVVTAQATSEPPDAAFCEAVRQLYGLNMTVLFDPNGVTGSVLDMRVNSADMVLTRGNVIEINGPWAFFVVQNTLESIFGY